MVDDSTQKLKKALNVGNIINQNINKVEFQGDFYQAYGQPQDRGVWFIWGGSGSGKSSHAMQVAKEISIQTGFKIIHNLCEEETDDQEYIDRVKNLNMSEIDGKYLANSYTYNQFVKYLEKPTSPRVVIIDSATYFFKDKAQYMDFAKKFKSKKIIIITGHAEGSKPRSELEKDIMYNAKQKIFASGYLASCKGRSIGPNGGTFEIWTEGRQKLIGQQQKQES
ncbi:MAG: hypothetical protein JST78_09700 [Bacteroidetes bacterium]|nr:hypothetical protein [Bacteroidota bacterium]